MSDIGERVKKIVVEHLGVEPDKVTENASFIDDLGADSLDTVELVMAFEEEFGCENSGRCRRNHFDRGRRHQIPRKEREELTPDAVPLPSDGARGRAARSLLRADGMLTRVPEGNSCGPNVRRERG